jgi:molybdate transport system permease protein
VAMLTKLKRPGFKIITMSFGLLLAIFILAQILCLVTYTTPEALIKSLASREIRFAIRLSLTTAAISTILCIVISVPAAYGLVRYNFTGKSLLNAILNVPLALPPLVAGLGLLILFGTTPFGRGLAKAGLVFVYSPLGIIMAQFFVNVPFMLRIMRSTFQGINPRYEYIAQALGCTEAQAFWRVTLPMSKEGLLAGSIITWSRGIGEFGAALMVAGATRMKTEILPISLYLNMSCGELDLAIAAATILILISLTSLFLFERYSGPTHLF